MLVLLGLAGGLELRNLHLGVEVGLKIGVNDTMFD